MRRIQRAHRWSQRQSDKLRVRSLLSEAQRLRRELENRR